MELHHRKLYAAGCISLIAAAFTFSIRTDTMGPMQSEFGFSDYQIGRIAGPAMWGFGISIFLGGVIIDRLGMKTLMVLAFFGHTLGALITIFANQIRILFHVPPDPQNRFCFWILLSATLLVGLANGFMEAVINPLTATLYKRDKAKYLNMLHAWWPGGMILGGLLSYLLTYILGLNAPAVTPERISLAWKIKTALILVPTFIYGALLVGEKFPETERVARGVSYGEMVKECLRPFFILFFFLMMLTASTELGPDQWIGPMLQKLVGLQGILFLVYTSGIMFVLRYFLAGTMVKRLTPLGLLIFASVFSAIGLFLLSFIKPASGGGPTVAMGGAVLVAATIYGLGKAYFWPTMMGVVAERVPRGGALAFAILGSAGVLSTGAVTVPKMGAMQDRFSLSKLESIAPATLEKVIKEDRSGLDERKVLEVEQSSPADRTAIQQAKNYSAAMTFRCVALLPVILAIVFTLVFLKFRSRGGYTAHSLHDDEGVETPGAQ